MVSGAHAGMDKIALFPLQLVLFPGSQLPLRIFETRYIDLVSECLQSDSGFGICLIQQGSEVGGGALCCPVGCYTKIIDWTQLEDGLLGITIQAERRFRAEHFSERANKLLEAEVEWLEDDETAVGEEFELLQDTLTRILEHFDVQYDAQEVLMNNASWLGYRLAEFLPLSNEEKQGLLELDSNENRLTRLQKILQQSEVAVQ